MGSIGLMLMLLMMSGGRANPGLVQMIVTQRRESFRKWSTIINEAQETIVAAYFYWRAPQEFADASDPTKPAYSLEAVNLRIKAFNSDFLQQTLWGKLLGGVTRSIIALIEPSAAEEALMTALMSGALGGGGFGTTNNVNVQPAAPAGRSAGQVLRGGPRAQAVYVGPDGNTYVG